MLVVENSADKASLLSRLLGRLSHDVGVVCDGPSAEEARRHRPKVILLDIGLPGMDGYEVARRLRSEEWSRETLTAALSEFGQPEDPHPSRAAGYDDHLVKPVIVDDLKSLLVLRSG